MGISNLSFSATNINVGLDADKNATPRAGDMYLATDTELLYKCYTDDSWVSDELTEAKIDAAKSNIAKIKNGNYVGNDTVNRAIPHELGAVPKTVDISADGYAYSFKIVDGVAQVKYLTSSNDAVYTVTAMDATNFYVGNATSYGASANSSANTHRWEAKV